MICLKQLNINIMKGIILQIGEDLGTLQYFNGRITMGDVERLKPDLLVSYRYRYMITKDIIDFMSKRLGIINCHISLLPHNRGADPNLWSLINNTPKGVTIHYIDEGLDTGYIINQREVFFDKNDTLKSLYKKLDDRLRGLIMPTLFQMHLGILKPVKQPPSNAKTHHAHDLDLYKKHLFENKGFDTLCIDVKKDYEKFYTISS